MTGPQPAAISVDASLSVQIVLGVTFVDALDALDVAVGTNVVLRRSWAQIWGPIVLASTDEIELRRLAA
jgi:hypothetical protein